jgi:hypothetical protein
MAQIQNHRGDESRPKDTFPHDYGVRYWTERLGVSPEDVREAVKRVRSMVQESRRDPRK